MELAKITSKGQITIPIAIRKLLGVKDGDNSVCLSIPAIIKESPKPQGKHVV